jgi:hypothetical protein
MLVRWRSFRFRIDRAESDLSFFAQNASGQWRSFPVFTTLIAFNVALTALLYLIYTQGSHAWYGRVY